MYIYWEEEDTTHGPVSHTTHGHVKSLEMILGASGSDKARPGNGRGEHGYTPYYENLFEPLRTRKVRLLEIGVEMGRNGQIHKSLAIIFHTC